MLGELILPGLLSAATVTAAARVVIAFVRRGAARKVDQACRCSPPRSSRASRPVRPIADGDEWVSTDDLFQYVHDVVPRLSDQTPEVCQRRRRGLSVPHAAVMTVAWRDRCGMGAADQKQGCRGRPHPVAREHAAPAMGRGRADASRTPAGEVHRRRLPIDPRRMGLPSRECPAATRTPRRRANAPPSRTPRRHTNAPPPRKCPAAARMPRRRARVSGRWSMLVLTEHLSKQMPTS